ncbi:hypothetical protein O9G_000340 [Rozella allomycis CSF55]|uniref:GOST seven transmembrane domain-containing protein n=1 Tax=Rozella allomycis (strain CSF55) TaxID=988480 RepID=A0A075ATS1_ROZAC|nr:hypothetical protein O9G_000340 [Rozella allomycis CSF55]|eukprot:EPZ33565.1 hypothetical protein O9G_000340 [Rozella allomycis CSF55]
MQAVFVGGKDMISNSNYEPKDESKGVIGVYMFNYLQDKEKLKEMIEKESFFCVDKVYEQLKTAQCDSNKFQQPLVPDGVQSAKSSILDVEKNQLTFNVDDLKGTGLYVVVFQALSANAVAKGTISITNASGYLNIEEYPLIQFYLTLFVILSLVMIGWIVLCYIFKKDLQNLQKVILALIGVLVIENGIQTWFYSYMNSTGVSLQGFH